MRLTRVRAWNFKSFRELDIRLDGLNVVIGANASGKSNFVQLFVFIKDIVESGLENAISIQGGAQYLRHMSCGADDVLAVDLFIETDLGDPIAPFLHDGRAWRAARFTYHFSLGFQGGRKVYVAEDQLDLQLTGNGTIPDSTIAVRRTENEYQFEGDPSQLGSILVATLNARSEESRGRTLLVEVDGLRWLLPLSGLKSIGTYDVDPKGPKVGVLFGGKSDLDPDGGNLAIALFRILSDDEDRRKLLNLLKAVLPFADGLGAEQMRDSSFLFNVRESFSRGPVPAAFLSDGTIDVIALLVILYFERKSLVVIEEPQRNLHPSLISRVVELLKDASRLKQIIVSTHNPEVVRYADPEQLILISRDASGSSHASRPADKAQVQRFLREEIGMHELYVENLLEA